MANITPYNGGAMPQPSAAALARRAAGLSVAKRFTAGITSAFPRMSIKGKKFTLTFGEIVHTFVDQATGAPQPIDVVLLNSSPYMNKSYYKKGWEEDSDAPPDCWSTNGIAPSPESADIQSTTCGKCQWNHFKSATRTEKVKNPATGKDELVEVAGKGKACADSKRLALALPNDLTVNQVGPIALRVPVTSHKALKQYVDELDRLGFDPNTCVTKIFFDFNYTHQVFTFQFVRRLEDDEVEAMGRWENDERVERILQAPPEGDVQAEGKVKPADQPAEFAAIGALAGAPAAAPVAAAPAPAPAPVAAAPAPAPVTQGVSPPPGFAALEDGTWFNGETGEFLDPSTIAPPAAPPDEIVTLPNGKRLNKRTMKFVEDNYVPPPNVVIKPRQEGGEGKDAATEAKWTPPAAQPAYTPPATAPTPVPVKQRRRGQATEAAQADVQTQPGTVAAASPDVQKLAAEQQAKIAAATAAQEASKAQPNGGAPSAAQAAPKGLEQVLGLMGTPTPRPAR